MGARGLLLVAAALAAVAAEENATTVEEAEAYADQVVKATHGISSDEALKGLDGYDLPLDEESYATALQLLAAKEHEKVAALIRPRIDLQITSFFSDGDMTGSPLCGGNVIGLTERFYPVLFESLEALGKKKELLEAVQEAASIVVATAVRIRQSRPNDGWSFVFDQSLMLTQRAMALMDAEHQGPAALELGQNTISELMQTAEGMREPLLPASGIRRLGDFMMAFAALAETYKATDIARDIYEISRGMFGPALCGRTASIAEVACTPEGATGEEVAACLAATIKEEAPAALCAVYRERAIAALEGLDERVAALPVPPTPTPAPKRPSRDGEDEDEEDDEEEDDEEGEEEETLADPHLEAIMFPEEEEEVAEDAAAEEEEGCGAEAGDASGQCTRPPAGEEGAAAPAEEDDEQHDEL